MTEDTSNGHREIPPTRLTNNDLKILNDLMSRTEALPDILHLRAAERGYEFTEKDKELLLDTYSKLDDILKEVAAFINIKFPGCERHVRAWNDIDFDTKIGPLKIATTDREHIKREWKKGIFDLKSLIKILKNETVLRIESNEDIQTMPQESRINHFSGNVVYNERAGTSIQNTSNAPFPQDSTAKGKSSWLEKVYWIAGILTALIALYALFK